MQIFKQLFFKKMPNTLTTSSNIRKTFQPTASSLWAKKIEPLLTRSIFLAPLYRAEKGGLHSVSLKSGCKGTATFPYIQILKQLFCNFLHKTLTIRQNNKRKISQENETNKGGNGKQTEKRKNRNIGTY